MVRSLFSTLSTECTRLTCTDGKLSKCQVVCVLMVRIGYGYGTITATWGRYLRYVQLQLQLTQWDSFAVSFFLDYSPNLSLTRVDCFLDFCWCCIAYSREYWYCLLLLV